MGFCPIFYFPRHTTPYLITPRLTPSQHTVPYRTRPVLTRPNLKPTGKTCTCLYAIRWYFYRTVPCLALPDLALACRAVPYRKQHGETCTRLLAFHQMLYSQPRRNQPNLTSPRRTTPNPIQPRTAQVYYPFNRVAVNRPCCGLQSPWPTCVPAMFIHAST